MVRISQSQEKMALCKILRTVAYKRSHQFCLLSFQVHLQHPMITFPERKGSDGQREAYSHRFYCTIVQMRGQNVTLTLTSLSALA